MNPYHKIETVFLRDPKTRFKTLLHGEFARQEFEYLKDCEWIFTEKVDGTNIRIMFDGQTITFGGRTDNAQIPSHLANALNATFLPQIDVFKDSFPDGVCLYGEGYGAKIQKAGGNYRSDQAFVLFDVLVGSWWLKRDGVEDVAGKIGLTVVPTMGSGSLDLLCKVVSDGFKSTWGDFPAEGIVARPAVELVSRNGTRIITKLKCKDFPHS